LHVKPGAAWVGVAVVSRNLRVENICSVQVVRVMWHRVLF
jgi:hypothetical protein